MAHCEYFNNALFTKNSVPFQLSDDEEISYFNTDVQFYLHAGNGIPIETEIYKSASGHVFLTQYRFLYKTREETNNFNSFCIPLREIVAISENSTIDFIFGTFLQSIYLDFGYAQKSVFFHVLEELLKNITQSFVEDNDSDPLPFYSDVKDG